MALRSPLNKLSLQAADGLGHGDDRAADGAGEGVALGGEPGGGGVLGAGAALDDRQQRAALVADSGGDRAGGREGARAERGGLQANDQGRHRVAMAELGLGPVDRGELGLGVVAQEIRDVGEPRPLRGDRGRDLAERDRARWHAVFLERAWILRRRGASHEAHQRDPDQRRRTARAPLHPPGGARRSLDRHTRSPFAARAAPRRANVLTRYQSGGDRPTIAADAALSVCYDAGAMSERTSEEHLDATRAYYDEFSTRYEAQRDGHDPGGYHDLLDELEVDFVAALRSREGRARGRLRDRPAPAADRSASRAGRAGWISRRACSPTRASAASTCSRGARPTSPSPTRASTSPARSRCSPTCRRSICALAEMARVMRPGGDVLAEFYNPLSFRGLAKRLGPAGKISEKTDESAVFTRFDPPWKVAAMAPRGTRLVASRGIRIVTPAAVAMRVPVLGSALRFAERALCDSPLRHFGGFWIAVLQKDG